MTATTAFSLSEIELLRHECYNATVIKIRWVHDDLMILRLQLDGELPAFLPGQYTSLGMGAWEPQNDKGRDRLVSVASSKNLIKRLYSISCSLIDDHDRLVRTGDCPYFEFYIKRVRPTDSSKLVLTPRLFALHEGARLFCGREVRGRYTLQVLPSTCDVVFVATGTGEAPHNAMVAELLATGFAGQIVSVTCAKKECDLAYSKAHRKLERRFPNYRYLSLTTREPVNLDPRFPGFVGKRYLQDYFTSGDFECDADLQLLPDKTHIFLCGSPNMIGRSHAVRTSMPKAVVPIGMIELLEGRGFRLEHAGSPGNIHVERYW